MKKKIELIKNFQFNKLKIYSKSKSFTEKGLYIVGNYYKKINQKLLQKQL